MKKLKLMHYCLLQDGAINPHSAPQNVATEEGVRRQETGDRILEENHNCRD